MSLFMTVVLSIFMYPNKALHATYIAVLKWVYYSVKEKRPTATSRIVTPCLRANEKRVGSTYVSVSVCLGSPEVKCGTFFSATEV